MDKEFMNGLMEKNIQEILLIIKEMDMVYLYFQIKKNMRENGKMGNSMVKEKLFWRMEELKKEIGLKELKQII